MTPTPNCKGTTVIKSDVLGFCALCGCAVTLAIVFLLTRQIEGTRARIKEVEAQHHARELALIEALRAHGKSAPAKVSTE